MSRTAAWMSVGTIETAAAAAVCVLEGRRRWKKWCKSSHLSCTRVRKKRRCSRKGDLGAEKLNALFLMTSAGGLKMERWTENLVNVIIPE